MQSIPFASLTWWYSLTASLRSSYLLPRFNPLITLLNNVRSPFVSLSKRPGAWLPKFFSIWHAHSAYGVVGKTRRRGASKSFLSSSITKSWETLSKNTDGFSCKAPIIGNFSLMVITADATKERGVLLAHDGDKNSTPTMWLMLLLYIVSIAKQFWWSFCSFMCGWMGNEEYPLWNYHCWCCSI